MIAIPVKTNKSDTAISTSFGKAKWFALVDENGKTHFWRNEKLNGRSVIESLTHNGVEHVLLQSIGERPFQMLQQQNIKSYYAGDTRLLLTDSLEAFANKHLPVLTLENMSEYITHKHHH